MAYDLERSDMWFTATGLVRGEDAVTLNAVGSWYGVNRNTGADESGADYLTIQLIWKDGMWQVDRWQPCTEQDYQNGVLQLSAERISE